MKHFYITWACLWMPSRCRAQQANAAQEVAPGVSVRSAKLTLWFSKLEYMSRGKISSFENAIDKFLSSSISECNGSTTIKESSLSATILSQTMESYHQHHQLVEEENDDPRLVVHVHVDAELNGHSTDVNDSLESIIGCYFNEDHIDGFSHALFASSLLFIGCCDHSNMRALVFSDSSHQKIVKEEQSRSGGFDHNVVVGAFAFGVVLAPSILAGYFLFRRAKDSSSANTSQLAATQNNEDVETILYSDTELESKSGAMSMIDLDNSQYGFSLFAEEPYCWMIENDQSTPKKLIKEVPRSDDTKGRKCAETKTSKVTDQKSSVNATFSNGQNGKCNEESSLDLYNKQITFRAPPGPLGICISMPVHGRIPFIENIKPSSPLIDVARQFDSIVMIDNWELKGSSLDEIAQFLKERQHQTRIVTIFRRPEV